MARTTASPTTQINEVLRTHWLLILIVIIATFLRVWQIDTHAIFFGDAAHDLLTAITAVEEKKLPLLGIASSVPRFKQGPVTIWIEMLLYPFFGYHLLGYSLFFVILGLSALIGLYELAVVFLNKQTALVSSFLLAFSPLAIAHARMVYHVTPLPLALVLYLWALMRWWQHQPTSLFWATLAFAFCFQFELAVFPLLLLIPYIWWKRQHRLTVSVIIQGLAGLGLGLAPQLIFDLTHGFQQLGGFGIWMGYRLGSFAVGDHAPSLNKITTFLDSMLLYGGRIGAVEYTLGLMWLVLVVVTVAWTTHQFFKKELPPLSEITLIATYLLFFSYFIHGSPSEAYYPPFLILIPLILGYFLSTNGFTTAKRTYVTWSGLTLWAFVTTISIFQTHFFVSVSHPFNYGPGSGEQRAIVTLIKSHQIPEIQLRTTSEAGMFENYFDNFRFLGQSVDLMEDSTATTTYFVEVKDSPLARYPNFMKYSFPSVDVYRPL